MNLIYLFYKEFILHILVILGFISILIFEIPTIIFPSIIKSFLSTFYFFFLEFYSIFKNNVFKEKLMILFYLPL
jgi:hypothetical protein